MLDNIRNSFANFGKTVAGEYKKLETKALKETNPVYMTLYFSIPFVGGLFQQKKSELLKQEYKTAANIGQKIEILHKSRTAIKCQFISNIVSSLALLALGIATGSLPLLMVGSMLVGSTIGSSAVTYHRNLQSTKELEALAAPKTLAKV